VLYSLTYAVVRLLLEVLIVRGRPNAKLSAEVLALAISFGCSSDRWPGLAGSPPTVSYSRPLVVLCPGQPGARSCPAPRRCSAGIGSWSAANGPPTRDALADWDRFPGAAPI
jgi:hypothetical protein